MKIICIDNTHPQAVPVFYLKPDTALLRNNQPFFYPDFTTELHANISLILKINRLGRSIAENFAARYFDSIGLGITLMANDILNMCHQCNLPWETAHCFDYSASISPDFVKVETIENIRSISFALSANGTIKIESSVTGIPFTFEQIIGYISKYITLKVGDYIFINAPSPSIPVKIGDKLCASLDGKEMLKTAIK